MMIAIRRFISNTVPLKLKNNNPIENKVLNQLKKVLDPELGVSIVDLGLIYEVEVDGKIAKVLMTLTFPGCPMISYMKNDIKEELLQLPEIKKVEIALTFDPPWSKEMVSKELKKKFNF